MSKVIMSSNILSASSYVRVGALTRAFSDAVANPNIPNEQIIEEMGQVARALRRAGQPQIEKLYQRLEHADLGLKGLERRAHGISEFLSAVSKSTLIETGKILHRRGLLRGANKFAEFADVSARVKTALGAGTETALQTREVAPEYDIRVGGVQYKMPAQLVTVAPVVSFEYERIPVENPPDVQSLAIDNLNEAITRYFGDQLYQGHTEYLPAHLEAIISGELDAPLEIREAIVDYVAESPEHAEAYGIKVLQDALLANILRDPLPVIVNLADLVPREARPPQVERKAAEPLVSSINTLDRDQFHLQCLLRDNWDVVSQLAEENPEAFGIDRIMGLISAAVVLLQARRIGGTTDKASYLYNAQELGMIPEGYIQNAKDPKMIAVEMPQGSPQKESRSWEQPIAAYMASEKFKETMAEKPTDSSEFPFREWLYELGDKNQRVGFSLELLDREINKGEFDNARKGYDTARLNFLRDKITRLADNGLHQMDGLRGQVRAQLDAGNFPQAEALLDFAEEWVCDVVACIDKREQMEAMLFVIGERQASKKFREIYDQLLSVGDSEGMSALLRNMKKEIRGRDVTIKAKQDTLSNRIVTAVAATFETVRSLAAIPAAETRAPLAARVPPISYFMKPGSPNTPEQARASLSARGIPLPGDEGVPAIGAPGVRGYDIPAIPAPGKGSLGITDGNK